MLFLMSMMCVLVALGSDHLLYVFIISENIHNTRDKYHKVVNIQSNPPIDWISQSFSFSGVQGFSRCGHSIRCARFEGQTSIIFDSPAPEKLEGRCSVARRGDR